MSEVICTYCIYRTDPLYCYKYLEPLYPTARELCAKFAPAPRCPVCGKVATEHPGRHRDWCEARVCKNCYRILGCKRCANSSLKCLFCGGKE